MKHILLFLSALAIATAMPSATAATEPPSPPPASEQVAPTIAEPHPASPLAQAVTLALSLLCVGALVNTHGTVDKNLLVTKALPAASASNNSDAIDLTTTTGGRIPGVELSVALPATPSLVDDKSITLTLKDSADGVTFAAIADLPAITVTGAGGAGGGAVDRRFKLPIGVRRYIRLDQAVEAAGGDNTAISGTLSLVF